MTTKFEFVDGFDGWVGMGAYTSLGADASHSPWKLRDRTADLGFDPGDTDYSNLVDPEAGMFGGGALKLPIRSNGTLLPRNNTHFQIDWFPRDQYTMGGVTYQPETPYVMTWGFYLKTDPNGQNGYVNTVGMDLVSFAPETYRESSGIPTNTDFYAEWSAIARPDGVIWTGWYYLGEGNTTETVECTFEQQAMMGFGDKFYWIDSTLNLVTIGDEYPLMGGSDTISINDILQPPLETAYFAKDITHNFVDKFYVLAEALGGETRVYEFNTDWTDTGVTWDIEGDCPRANGICYLRGDDTFIVGPVGGTGRTMCKFSSAFVLQSSGNAPFSNSGEDVFRLSGMPRAGTSYWYHFVRSNGLSDARNTDDGSGIPSYDGPSEDDHSGIYDDGFWLHTVGGARRDETGNKGKRIFYRGLLMPHVGYFPKDFPDNVAIGEPERPEGILFNWGDTPFIELAWRAISNPNVSTHGVGVATQRVDGVKLPEGVGDTIVTAGEQSGVRPYVGAGNHQRLFVFSPTRSLLTSGPVAFMDDFYMKANTTPNPTEDPQDYEGQIRIHTLRPTRVSGDLAPVGDFSIFGWFETVNREHAFNDNTSYLVAQNPGDSSRIYLEDVNITGTVACVVPMVSLGRDTYNLEDSIYPRGEHLAYPQIGVTSSNTAAGLQDTYQLDPTNYAINFFTSVCPWNDHVSADCDMYGMMTSYMISETDPLTGVAWDNDLLSRIKLHINTADGFPYTEAQWAWTNRDGI